MLSNVKIEYVKNFYISQIFEKIDSSGILQKKFANSQHYKNVSLVKILQQIAVVIKNLLVINILQQKFTFS
jgi:hypothetical protein